ncbi:hypothetical protein L6452_32470 [Arctium lappa]|uniref:Uncharacterized protein n=1 Tax=Arctium lappa TaxID=4217 RepID=A0ACB8Z5Y3_ARCLA|nr:hypothetical protein L6452_32470 [Arctium lappa]
MVFSDIAIACASFTIDDHTSLRCIEAAVCPPTTPPSNDDDKEGENKKNAGEKTSLVGEINNDEADEDDGYEFIKPPLTTPAQSIAEAEEPVMVEKEANEDNEEEYADDDVIVEGKDIGGVDDDDDDDDDADGSCFIPNTTIAPIKGIFIKEPGERASEPKKKKTPQQGK